MAELSSFEYVVLRVVPRIERGEAINAGVLVYSQAAEFLGGRVHLDRARARALDAGLDCAEVERALLAASDCTPQGDDDIGRRFRWLTAPRSTVVQPGPIHTGVTADPQATLERLFSALVLPLD